MTTIAMITARSTSSRFPRKHLADLGGKPMIVQIINKLKRLQQLDYIVLATSDNETDDELSEVSRQAGARVVRGSESDLVQRHSKVLHETEADYVLNISGDCPFQDIRGIQLVIDTALTNYGYDSYGITGPYALHGEMLASCLSYTWFSKMFKIFEEHKDEFSTEQYWIAGSKYPEAFSTYKIDGSHIMPVAVTPMKTSVDWPLENQIWQKVIKYLGYYPEKMEDINKAFANMKL